jgi:hypothetical protein
MVYRNILFVIILFVAFVSMNSCANYSKKIQGMWLAEIENEYDKAVSERDGVPRKDTMLHTVEIIFDDGKYEVLIKPSLYNFHRTYQKEGDLTIIGTEIRNEQRITGDYYTYRNRLILRGKYLVGGKSTDQEYKIRMRKDKLCLSIKLKNFKGDIRRGAIVWGRESGILEGCFDRVEIVKAKRDILPLK